MPQGFILTFPTSYICNSLLQQGETQLPLPTDIDLFV